MNARPVFKAQRRPVNDRYVGAVGQNFASPIVWVVLLHMPLGIAVKACGGSMARPGDDAPAGSDTATRSALRLQYCARRGLQEIDQICLKSRRVIPRLVDIERSAILIAARLIIAR